MKMFIEAVKADKYMQCTIRFKTKQIDKSMGTISLKVGPVILAKTFNPIRKMLINKLSIAVKLRYAGSLEYRKTR